MHFRVWWFWLPLILSGMGLLLTAVLIGVAPVLAMGTGLLSAVLAAWASISGIIIVRGQRGLEFDDFNVRITDYTGTFEFRPEQVTDMALFRVPQHAGGRLIAECREMHLWVDAHHGTRKLRLVSRVPPHCADLLEDLADLLTEQLTGRAVNSLSAGESIAGDGWTLDRTALRVAVAKSVLCLPVDSIAAVETVGQEIRVWQTGQPRAVCRLPLSGRNTWLLERVLPGAAGGHREAGRALKGGGEPNPLGRILFERTPGRLVPLLFAAIGMAIMMFSLMALWAGVRLAEPILFLLGVLLGVVGMLCVIGGWRVRRIRFCCHEHGLERVTMTGRQVLKFSEIDVFSFEARRNHAHGRYTGTTYTMVFADRSRAPGRGIFFSTTVRNTDDELELLRDRVSEPIARRLAAAFARLKRVQWTPDLWLHEDVLEFSRPRRLFSPPKLAVVPYDAITDFEIRDGLFHVWTNYQERAVISVKTSSANFYPGLIVLEGLVNAHTREPAESLTR